MMAWQVWHLVGILDMGELVASVAIMANMQPPDKMFYACTYEWWFFVFQWCCLGPAGHQWTLFLGSGTAIMISDLLVVHFENIHPSIRLEFDQAADSHADFQPDFLAGCSLAWITEPNLSFWMAW